MRPPGWLIVWAEVSEQDWDRIDRQRKGMSINVWLRGLISDALEEGGDVALEARPAGTGRPGRPRNDAVIQARIQARERVAAKPEVLDQEGQPT